MLTQVETLQDFIGGNYLFPGVRRQRDADSIADAKIQQRADADRAANNPRSGQTGFRNAQVQGIRNFFGNTPVSFNRSRNIKGFQRYLNQVEVKAFQQLHLL